jgi:multiple sugar transport system permease protein
MGYAAAMAWLLVLIIGILTAINFLLSKYWVFYDD